MAIQDELKKKHKNPAESGGSSQKKRDLRGLFPKKGDSPREAAHKVIFLLAVVVLAASLSILFDYFYQGWKAQRQTRELSSLYDSAASASPSQGGNSSQGSFNSFGSQGCQDSLPQEDEARPILPEAAELLKVNPDTVGWIRIEDTNIDLPVVLREGPEEGNSYYLTHNFLGEKQRSGTVFADYRTTLTDTRQSDNVILYGHNEANNTMFGDLDQYKQVSGGRDWSDEALEFYKSHPTFEFNTNYERATYKIFAYFVTSTEQKYETEPLFDYNNYIDFDEARYTDFIENIKKRNVLSTPVDARYGDQFVTLSTCSNEYSESRLVVFGRKVRPGEAPEVDVSGAAFVSAKDRVEPDWDTIYGRKK